MNIPPTFIELPSEPMQDIYHTVQQVVASDLSFFVTGETGVGKEGVAQYIHKSSPRRSAPFVAINCGRFTSELLQSELFGHEEGAFTGASHQRKGAFERVNGGILFLDEVTEMSAEAQRMMLRVLDTQTFTRMGGNEKLEADFQVIAATNRNIGEAVLKTEFRADLYYRLMDMTLHVPPLRERAEDISPLVHAFIHAFTPKRGKGVTGIAPEALLRLEQAAWPGNIRQLRSTVRTAIALATTDKLEIKDFPYNFFTVPVSEKPDTPPTPKAHTSIHPEFVQTLLSLWKTLPAEVQHTIIHELSTHLAELWRNFQTAQIAPADENGELLNISGMNQHQILRAVAEKRIAECASLNEAAHSLDIDIRTLQRHADWTEQDESET